MGASGDLGSQLATAITAAGHTVLCSDPKLKHSLSLTELLNRCDIVHFCLPEPAFSQPITLQSRQIAVLHDSVMQTSERINARWFDGQASIVHLLMNRQKRVIVRSRTKKERRISQHLSSLGFSVERLTARQHDKIMAMTQAPLALLLGLLPSLNTLHEQGILTDSAETLRTALHARSLRWTPATITALLKNPELDRLLILLRKGTL